MLGMTYPRGGSVSSGPGGEYTPAHLFTSFPNGTHTTASVTFTPPAGLTAPITYAWSVLSGSDPITINMPTAATTTFTATATNTEVDGMVRCVATDALGTVVTGSDYGMLLVFGSPP